MARLQTEPVLERTIKNVSGRVDVLEGRIGNIRRVATETAEARLDALASDMAEMRADIEALRRDVQILVEASTP